VFVLRLILNLEVHFVGRLGAHPKGGCRVAAPPQIEIKRKRQRNSVDTMLTMVLCDLPSSRNQPQKKADD